jgi:hypothetical protein
LGDELNVATHLLNFKKTSDAREDVLAESGVRPSEVSVAALLDELSKDGGDRLSESVLKLGVVTDEESVETKPARKRRKGRTGLISLSPHKDGEGKEQRTSSPARQCP